MAHYHPIITQGWIKQEAIASHLGDYLIINDLGLLVTVTTDESTDTPAFDQINKAFQNREMLNSGPKLIGKLHGVKLSRLLK